MNRNNLRFLWLVIIAVLKFFEDGRWNFTLAAWLVPVFAMRFFRSTEKPGRDFLFLWFFTAIPVCISLHGVTPFNNLSPLAEPIFYFLVTPVGLLPYVVDRFYSRRFGSRFWVMLVFPIAATGISYLSAGNSPLGTFGVVAYSQRGFLPLMQMASVAGVWGIVFVMSLFASIANYIWEYGFKRQALIYVSLLVLVFGFGVGRMWFAAQPAHTPRVAGFSLPNGTLKKLGQFGSDDEIKVRKEIDEFHNLQVAEIRRLARQGANIVVLQEGAGIGYPDQVNRLLAEVAAVAKEMQIYIVLPTYTIGKQIRENIVRILDPQGQVALEHVKYGGNMLEGGRKGDGLLKTVETPYGKLSAIICWDADFPNIVRQTGQKDVELLFIPVGDWLEVRNIHAGMATFRAVENGMSIFRQAGQGVSLATDMYGREVNRVDSYAETKTAAFANIQIVDVPIGHIRTLYPWIGDALGQIMLLGLAGQLVGMLWKRNKK